MNCDDFNDVLYDYIDGSIEGGREVAVREHLRQCEVCQSALAREKAVGNSLRHSLEQATAGLCLSGETRRNILKARETKPAWADYLARGWRFLLRMNCSSKTGLKCASSPRPSPPSIPQEERGPDLSPPQPDMAEAQMFRGILFPTMRLMTVGAALIVGLLAFETLRTSRGKMANSKLPPTAQSDFSGCVVDVPIQTQIHVFKQRNGMIVDNIVTGVAIGHGEF